ncbi:CpaF family protein [Oceanibacterium hippocampi]|uniref:Putative conjugal transfer protein/MT3759 n=1 Tax=Oceanibacterium hippocampi TaxID=745714 RepID=A0A1Y5TBL6_9PROT|nr:CpaF family protein [Oceanibacterium hippocampi]SLN58362.1 Putative conjugal transfer protein/MT3759 [Oceanibacterium hippocampi]
MRGKETPELDADTFSRRMEAMAAKARRNRSEPEESAGFDAVEDVAQSTLPKTQAQDGHLDEFDDNWTRPIGMFEINGFGKVDPQIVRRVLSRLMELIEPDKAIALSHEELSEQIVDLTTEILEELKIRLNFEEQRQLIRMLVDEMVGLGPLEPLLADETVTDIMVNGPERVFVEREGKCVAANVRFRDEAQLMTVAQRIVSRIGRRIDESTPLVDARLADGSRVNIIAPPLAIDGTSISIRKFSRNRITIDQMTEQENLSPEMAVILKVAARTRLNIVISGGTGSGKTTMLNALSCLIDPSERIVTIEDTAELQLDQPNLVRLETRPSNIEGSGEFSQRDLFKNALRMRPDRIVLGEVRGAEAIDMLQAMNTGHDGSLCTLHANGAREALTRLENMVAMSGMRLPGNAVRGQISSAINLIIQVARLRDGKRRVTQISEVIGMEGDVVTLQNLFEYVASGEDRNGRLIGEFRFSGLRPRFYERAKYFGLQRRLDEVLEGAEAN